MTIRDIQGGVEDMIPVKNVLVSVSDKTGLDTFVNGLIQYCPGVQFMSTGGTYKHLAGVLGQTGQQGRLMEVSEYTDLPEMEGGLVKTLHPKIHAGILGERHNPNHLEYMKDILNNAVFIDMTIVNLYPFSQVVAKIERGEIDSKTSKPFNFESARGNIDIGGPTMLRGAAKNFLSCAAVCDKADYEGIIENIAQNEGNTDHLMRLDMARKVFETTSVYDTAIAKFLNDQDDHVVREQYFGGK